MLRLQAFKFELLPNGAEERQMRRFAGCRRFIYNMGVELEQTRYAQGEKHLGYTALCAALKDWKAEASHTWLLDAPSQVLQQGLKDLTAAYTNFFAGRAKTPRFKRKGIGDSFRYPQGVELDAKNARVFLPKLGWVRYRKSREVLGEIKNTTVSRRAGRWFVSMQTEREVEIAPARSRSALGIDVGIARFATLSDGRFFSALHSFRRHERALAKAQRAFSRKEKRSRNYRKAGLKVARIQARIADCRRDFLHQITSRLSKSHALVCVEDLMIGNMSRSASGTKESPGKNVAAKSGLSRAILDQGWGEFRRQLEYKLKWKGGQLLAVPAAGTSRTCPCCGHEDKANRQSQAAFRCMACGFEGNADWVGSVNILTRGMGDLDEGWDIEGRTLRVRLPQAFSSASRSRIARLACEANPTRGRQQEPELRESSGAF